MFAACEQVVMLCWSYFVAVVTEPGRVPQDWSPFATAEVRANNSRPDFSSKGATTR